LNHQRAFLASDWGRRTVAFSGHGMPLQADIVVREMMMDLQKQFATRRDELVSLLGINLDWRMHQLSDGQRRRVQIMLQLLRPSKFLLLDEITTDLDLITRQDFLSWLKFTSERDNITIIYATHIFDGLDDWATHIGYIAQQTLTKFGKIVDFEEYTSRRFNTLSTGGANVAPLLRTVEQWLRHDRQMSKDKGQSILETAERAAIDELRGAAGNGYLSGRFNNGFN